MTATRPFPTEPDVAVRVEFHHPHPAVYDFVTVFAFDLADALRTARLLAVGPDVARVVVSADPARAAEHFATSRSVSGLTFTRDPSTGLLDITVPLVPR